MRRRWLQWERRLMMAKRSRRKHATRHAPKHHARARHAVKRHKSRTKRRISRVRRTTSSRRKAHPHVIVYTTQTCPFCKMAKELIASRHVPFDERDVVETRQYAQEMMRKSGQMGVPVIDINGHIIIGYDKEAILKALHR
jgi:glutaredoxin-like YruB-family protein